jgi:hypothetical protein
MFSVTPSSPGPVVNGKNPASRAPFTACDPARHASNLARHTKQQHGTHLGQLPLPQGRGARVPPAPDLTERINEHAQQLHVHGTRHGARVSAVDKRVLFGAKEFGGCGALCAEIDGAVAT